MAFGAPPISLFGILSDVCASNNEIPVFALTTTELALAAMPELKPSTHICTVASALCGIRLAMKLSPGDQIEWRPHVEDRFRQ